MMCRSSNRLTWGDMRMYRARRSETVLGICAARCLSFLAAERREAATCTYAFFFIALRYVSRALQLERNAASGPNACFRRSALCCACTCKLTACLQSRRRAIDRSRADTAGSIGG